MDETLLKKLKDWRRNTANLEGVELFRVFANRVLENIAEVKPKNKEELMAIKGIRDRKYAKYGEGVLAIINGEESVKSSIDSQHEEPEKPFSVSAYLDFLNHRLRKYRARVQGEISSVDSRERVVYFSIKDSDDESVLNCLMWKSDYELSGIDFEAGMEVILEGFPDIYKPIGKLTFKALSAELVGEGALKKAYDELKKKLEREGIFSPDRKKPIPEFPQKIGLITSKTGAVIHDFESNLGKYGYRIKFLDSRVEGQIAVHDLIFALDYFRGKDIDVLVIIRGGGSYESLQAFNNEMLVRKIADMDMPVICGIGHDKDVSLVSLAADLMVSTPTAVTTVLNKSWDGALNDFEIFSRELIDDFQRILTDKKHQLETLAEELRKRLDLIFDKFNLFNAKFREKVSILGHSFKYTERALNSYKDLLLVNFNKHIQRLFNGLKEAESRLMAADPMRQLKLGYSIVSINGKIVKSVKQAKSDSELDIQVSDGKIKSRVFKIIN